MKSGNTTRVILGLHFVINLDIFKYCINTINDNTVYYIAVFFPRIYLFLPLELRQNFIYYGYIRIHL